MFRNTITAMFVGIMIIMATMSVQAQAQSVTVTSVTAYAGQPAIQLSGGYSVFERMYISHIEAEMHIRLEMSYYRDGQQLLRGWRMESVLSPDFPCNADSSCFFEDADRTDHNADSFVLSVFIDGELTQTISGSVIRGLLFAPIVQR